MDQKCLSYKIKMGKETDQPKNQFNLGSLKLNQEQANKLRTFINIGDRDNTHMAGITRLTSIAVDYMIGLLLIVELVTTLQNTSNF